MPDTPRLKLGFGIPPLQCFFYRCARWNQTSSPTVEVLNGSYYGVYNRHYHQDFFLISRTHNRLLDCFVHEPRNR